MLCKYSRIAINEYDATLRRAQADQDLPMMMLVSYRTLADLGSLPAASYGMSPLRRRGGRGGARRRRTPHFSQAKLL